MTEQILAPDEEIFKLVKEGYNQLKKNFFISECDLMIRKGIDLPQNKKRIDIAPLNSLGDIERVGKITRDLEWNLIEADTARWLIEGPEYDYSIHRKAPNYLVNY